MEHITFGLLAFANVLTSSVTASTASASVGTSATPVYSTVQVVSTATTTNQPADTADILVTDSPEADALIASSTDASTTSMSPTEAYVRNAFKDIPILIQIARCESQFRQTDKDGAILHGAVDKDDIGVMQINEHYQLKEAESLGFDITTLQGNVSYARYLYEKEGTKPWTASEKCWAPSSK